MALDGLSNQTVGIYRKDSSEKTERMAAKYKEKAEFNLTNIEETTAIDKVGDEQKKEKEKNNDDATKELILSKATQLVEGDDNETLQVVIENEETTQELTYTIKFNTQTQMIEMKNDKTSELIETIKPEDLMKVLSKAKSISGILVDRQI